MPVPFLDSCFTSFWCVKLLSCCSGTRKEGAPYGIASALFSASFPLIPAGAGMSCVEMLSVGASLLWGTV